MTFMSEYDYYNLLRTIVIAGGRVLNTFRGKVKNQPKESDLPADKVRESTLAHTVLDDLIQDIHRKRKKGEEKERRESLASVLGGFKLAMIAIFALLAIPFRSYTQPLLIMAAIPFGIVGAVIGHFIMNHDLSLLSMFGLVALSGVVVNDSLLLIDKINSNRREGASLHDAVIAAGIRRFRPILLTSLTTFFGLMPMIMETSVQAQFLVPMAISLGFGILFATGITLLLIPTFYLILEDIRQLFGLKDEYAQQHETES